MTSYFLCMIKNFFGPLICTVVLELWNMLWEEGATAQTPVDVHPGAHQTIPGRDRLVTDTQLKGQCHEIFTSGFFLQTTAPGPSRQA